MPLPLPLAPPQLRFYLHQDAAFNHSGVLAALKQRLAGRPMDVGLPVGEAQYLSDVPITAALERHPLRTNDPAAAALHVIGAVPFASSVLADASGDQSSHEARMNALAEQLERLPAFIERRKPFLLVHCSCSAKQLGVPLMQTLGRGNLIVASCDPYFARDFGKLPQPFAHAYRRGVTIPFYPHSLAHDATPLQRTSPQTPTHETPRATNRSGIMFHGGLGRYDHGLRDGMLELIGRVRKAGGVRVDTRIGEMSRGSNRSAYSRLSYAESGQSYRDASMCLVPAGDVPSSRRLFDVMSAGCVPVLVCLAPASSPRLPCASDLLHCASNSLTPPATVRAARPAAALLPSAPPPPGYRLPLDAGALVLSHDRRPTRLHDLDALPALH